MTSKIAVLLSGHGSTLQALIDAIDAGSLTTNICVVLSDQANAYGLERAKKAGIETALLTKQEYPSREAYDHELIQRLDLLQPNLIILAGFLRILSPLFVNLFKHKIINIHPSLLPKYPGLNTYQQAIKNHDRFHGTTIHYVTDDLDAGPIIAQEKCKIDENDTVETLKQRTQALEHSLYPNVIQALLKTI